MIKFENYSFTYIGNDTEAIKDVTLHLKKGGFYLLCGASGCGKTTLLIQMKKNLQKEGYISGNLWIDGKKIDEMDGLEAAAKIGYVSQEPEQMIVTDKVWHELAFGLESLGISQDKMKKRVAEVAQFFGLQEIYTKDTETLSGGQKQLLVLASVMAMQPDVLILDEPTSQLDPLAAAEFLHTIKRINEELGVTIIICEQRLEEVFELCDAIIFMVDGRIEKVGSKEQMVAYLSAKGKKDKFYRGLPAPVRIYGGLETDKNVTCPIGIKEGRLWFEDYCRRNVVKKSAQSASIRYSNKEVLRLNEVFFGYEDAEEAVLRSVNLTLHKGEWYCLLGGNGVGKSTLLKALCGQITCQQGSFFYEEKKVKPDKNMPMGRDGIVYLPQSPKVLFSQITVEEELLVMLEEPYCRQKEALTHEQKLISINDMLGRMNLTSVRGRHPYDLSGGQQQRLALAKLLLLNPTILLLDEPTKGMDPGFKGEFANIIGELLSEGRSVLMVSHDVEFAAEYTDTCGLLFDGEIITSQRADMFFAGNSFYTTNTNKMVRQEIDGAVTVAEVIRRCTTD